MISENGFASLMTSITGIEIGDAVGEVGDEVRPKNMIVQWIIRIY